MVPDDPKQKQKQKLLREIASLARDARMEEGDSWFLVAARWWRAHATAGEGPDDAIMTEGDGDDDDDDARVANAALVDIAFSSKQRKSVVLKPMLVRCC